MSYSWVPAGYDNPPLEEPAPDHVSVPADNELDDDLPPPPWLQPYYDTAGLLFRPSDSEFTDAGLPESPDAGPMGASDFPVAGTNESDAEARFLRGG